MRKAALIVITLLMILSLCSCASLVGKEKPSPSSTHSSAPSSPQVEAAQLPSETPEPETPEPETPEPQQSESPSEKPPSGFGSSLDQSAQPTPKPSPSASNEKTPLSAESLAYWTDYFAQQENYGFLLSNYKWPEDVDLTQLFYAGAGIATWDISQEEIDAYMYYYGMDEMWGGLMKLTSDQLDDFLMEKMGISIWDTTSYWDWLYLEQFDAFYVERSDTNYCILECVSGYKTEDGTVVIECQQPPDGFGQVDQCTVTLKKSGDRYLFVSNKAHMLY